MHTQAQYFTSGVDVPPVSVYIKSILEKLTSLDFSANSEIQRYGLKVLFIDYIVYQNVTYNVMYYNFLSIFKEF